MTSWRTKIDHSAIPPGQELHAVFFEPFDDTADARPCVAIQIPEASPGEIQEAFAMAAKLRTRVVIVTDTAEQAADIAKLGAIKLPLHRRTAYERASAGAIGRVM
jgi:hypothetical protein